MGIKGRSRDRILFLIFGGFLILYLIVAIHLNGFVIASDGLGYYAQVRSLVVDGDLHYANEFLEYNPKGHAVPSPFARTVTGHVPNKYFVGPALLWAPFVVIAHLLTLLVHAAGVALEPNGYSFLYQFFTGLGSIVYGLLGLLLIHRIARFFFKPTEATLAVCGVALGTNLLYYLTTELCMSHALSMFAVSLFVWQWLSTRNRRSAADAVLLGLSAGLMILIRPQNALFTVPIAMEWIGFFNSDNSRSSSIRGRIVDIPFVALGTIVAILPQLVVWKIVYGSFLIYSYENEGFHFDAPHLWESLFSARHGLISWTPLILPALIGACLFARRQPRIGATFLLLFGLQWYLNASWGMWWFGHSFGGRAYINCTFIFALGLAMMVHLVKDRPWMKRLTVTVGSVLIVWNLLFMCEYTIGMVPYDDAVEFRDIVENVPDIPDTMVRVLSRMQ